MNHRTTRYPLFSIFIIGLASCGECIKLYFEPDETFWVDVYNVGDVVVFTSTSDSLKHDSILITGKEHSVPTGECNTIAVSNYDNEGYLIYNTFKHDTFADTGNYFIQYVKEPKGTHLVLRVFNLEYSHDKFQDTVLTLRSGVQLKDCYVIHHEECYNGWSGFRINMFVWSKSVGLVLYTGENGEAYEIDANSANK